MLIGISFISLREFVTEFIGVLLSFLTDCTWNWELKMTQINENYVPINSACLPRLLTIITVQSINKNNVPTYSGFLQRLLTIVTLPSINENTIPIHSWFLLRLLTIITLQSINENIIPDYSEFLQRLWNWYLFKNIIPIITLSSVYGN